MARAECRGEVGQDGVLLVCSSPHSANGSVGFPSGWTELQALEALGVLALVAFGPRSLDRSSKPLLQLPAFIDNRGNWFAINKLAATKYPNCVILMELSA